MVLKQIQQDYKEKVQNLSDEAIKDIWVRKKCYTKKREHHREFKSGHFMESDEHDDVISQLKLEDGSSSLYQFMDDFLLGLQELRKVRDSDKSREEWVFDHMTKDSYSDEELVEEARKSLMATVEGVGMPLSKLVKSNIDSYADLEEVEVA